MAGRLDGTVALVTGASSGIGEATALALAGEGAVEQLGRLDVVINNAGLMLLGPIVGADTGEWKRMVELNVLGLMYVTAAALPHLLQAAESEPRRVSDLVHVSSVAGPAGRGQTRADHT